MEINQLPEHLLIIGSSYVDLEFGQMFRRFGSKASIILSKNILHKEHASIAGRPLPYVVFTDPHLGRISMTEKTAKELGHEFQVAKMLMSWVVRMIEVRETVGMIKAIVDAKTDQILDAAISGVEGGEIMAILQVAILGHLSYPVIRDAILSHPSLSESLNSLFDTLPG
jgi:pyruvate/2-oxoglutarate dehydrogenase complex dihydrolipoamide dehydrogenase (E3) component